MMKKYSTVIFIRNLYVCKRPRSIVLFNDLTIFLKQFAKMFDFTSVDFVKSFQNTEKER